MIQRVSVVIAAYNEASRISRVLSVVEDDPLVDEVIVVDDGSKDKTAEVAKRFDIILLENEKNLGKTLSVKKGIKAAKNEIILLLDADIVGLTTKGVDALVRPVINKQVDWTLSLRGNSFGFMKMLGVDWVSGERAIRKELLSDPFIWSRPEIGFGLETLMNKSFLNRGATFQSIYLPHLKVINKASKVGFIKGWYYELKMVKQISKVLPLHKVIGQFLTMSKLNKKYKKSLNLEQRKDEE